MLHVHDYGIQCDVEWTGQTALEIDCVGTWGVATLRLRQRGRGECEIEVTHGDNTQRRAVRVQGRARLLFGTCDGRVVWQLGHWVGGVELDPTVVALLVGEGRMRQASQQPIRVRPLAVVDLSNLSIWRDVHYVIPPYASLPRGRLGKRRWLLLGDNVPVSVDGRFMPHGVAQQDILGRVNIWSDREIP